jgi:arylsulfatase A-like enzyme
MIKTLKESDNINNTLILFTSDNGGVYSVTKQWPLRAGKGSYYEGGIREPMFAYWAGKITKGTITDTPVTNLDFYPTILEAAGINKPENKTLDGNSLFSLITKGEKLNNRALYWHFPIYLENGNKETQDLKFRTRPGSVIRLKEWKLIHYFENNDLELYNLKEDIGEKNNLTKLNPDKTKELLKMLKTWRKETNAPIPSKLNPEYQIPDF